MPFVVDLLVLSLVSGFITLCIGYAYLADRVVSGR